MAQMVSLYERFNCSIVAIQEVEQDYNIPVVSIVSLEHIVDYLRGQADQADNVDKIEAYRRQYGV